MTIATTDETAAEIVPDIPLFEGKHVDACTLKLVNSSVLDLQDVVLKVDDIIQITVEAKVVGVNHVVHEASGRLIRLQTARPLDARLTPFNPDYDNGVIRDE